MEERDLADSDKVTIVRKCAECGIEKQVTLTVREHRRKRWVCKECGSRNKMDQQ